VPLDRASSSLRWARQALALAKRGMTPAPAGLVRCTGQLATLAILADEELVRTLAGPADEVLGMLPRRDDARG
jgi:hypothetical protein